MYLKFCSSHLGHLHVNRLNIQGFFVVCLKCWCHVHCLRNKSCLLISADVAELMKVVLDLCNKVILEV